MEDAGFFGGDDDEDGDEAGGGGGVQIGLGSASGGGVMNVSSQGWFGSSLKPRRVRPQNLEFRVGDVVRYRDFALTCVVIGWDKQLRQGVHHGLC